MRVFGGIAKLMVDTMIGGPPQNTLLGAGLGHKREEELEPTASFVSAV
jgi:hypothetical protein